VTAGRCPVCGQPVPARDRPHGGRNARYCSGACKAKAYRTRQENNGPSGTGPPPLTAAARHARVIEIRQQITELTGILADTASGQQALFGTPGTSLAADATVTKRVTLHQAESGKQAPPLFGNAPN
jgi:hypothetical protein